MLDEHLARSGLGIRHGVDDDLRVPHDGGAHAAVLSPSGRRAQEGDAGQTTGWLRPAGRATTQRCPTPSTGLIAILDLEELEVNVFRGRSPQENRQRVFGGQVAGQALVAAGRTVEGGTVHSLHAYFLRPGDPTKPILYQVDRIRDGRTFTTRRVVAIQHGQRDLQPRRVVPARGAGARRIRFRCPTAPIPTASRRSRSASRR